MSPEEFRKAPFLRLIFPLVGGILLGRLLQCPAWFGWVCTVFSAGSILFSFLYQKMGTTPLLLCFIFLGIVLGRKPAVPDLPEGVFTGRVCDDIVPSGKGIRTLVDGIRYLQQGRWIRVRGKASVFLAGTFEPAGRKDRNLVPGARLIACGKLASYNPPMNPYQFDYGTLQKGKGILFQAYLDSSSWNPAGKDKAYGLKIQSVLWRRVLIERLESHISGKAQLTILTALLLGYRDEMEPVLKQNFARSGTMHILAVSGLHVGIIYLLPALLLKRLKQYPLASIPTGITVFAGLWFYAFLTGLSVSVVRAVAMCCIHGVALMIRRKVSPLHVISLAAFIIILARPAVVFEAGFQLSFSAVTGITLLYRRLLPLFPLPGWTGRRISQMVSVSLAAQLSTAPLAIYYFNMFSPASVLSNLVVIPLASLILYAGFGFFLFSGTDWVTENLAPATDSSNPVAEAFARVSQILASWLDWMSSFLEWFTRSIAGLQGTYIEGMSLIPSQVILLYACGGLALIYFRKRTARSMFIMMSAVILFLFVSSVREYRIQSHNNMYVFALRRETAIVFVHGRQSVLFPGNNTALIKSMFFAPDYGDLPYEIAPFFKRYKLVCPGNNRHTTSAQRQSTTFLWHSEICSPGVEGHYVDFMGKRILILRKWDELYCRQIQLPDADVLILCNNPGINLSRIANDLCLEQVIADGSNHPWYEKKIESACREAGLAFHSTRTEGCFSF